MKNYKAEKGNRTEWWSWMTLCLVLACATSLIPAVPIVLAIPVFYSIASVRRIRHIGLSRAWVFAWLPIVVLFPLFLAVLQVPNTISTLLWLGFFIVLPGCIAGDDKNA